MDLVGGVMIALHRAFQVRDEGRAFDGEIVVIVHGLVSFLFYKRLSARHCERSEAIQNLSADTVWIASLRAQ
ncbi:hypothetical protein ABIF69_010377 [Bradyrhizobium japonicum]